MLVSILEYVTLATLPGAQRKATPRKAEHQLWRSSVGQWMAVYKKWGNSAENAYISSGNSY